MRRVDLVLGAFRPRRARGQEYGSSRTASRDTRATVSGDGSQSTRARCPGCRVQLVWYASRPRSRGSSSARPADMGDPGGRFSLPYVAYPSREPRPRRRVQLRLSAYLWVCQICGGRSCTSAAQTAESSLAEDRADLPVGEAPCSMAPAGSPVWFTCSVGSDARLACTGRLRLAHRGRHSAGDPSKL